MPTANDGRWPPIYDFNELQTTIQSLIGSIPLEKLLYESGGAFSDFYQGDVIRLPSELPYIDENAEPAAEEATDLWVVLGNTCDFERKIEEVQWSQLVPIVDLGSDFPTEHITIFRRYRHYRQFYLPPWATAADDHHYIADFLRPVTIHKEAFARAEVLARLTYKGWLLFHSCVVRFLARGDGRNDPEPEATT